MNNGNKQLFQFNGGSAKIDRISDVDGRYEEGFLYSYLLIEMSVTTFAPDGARFTGQDDHRRNVAFVLRRRFGWSVN